ncbi:MAG: arsenate reductase ArsC [Finegoldia sp.]|nr:arsenate reductase ArsC [Finegoldia sp.]
MKSVAFICVHNSCRSQMAEGFAKALGKDVLEVYSAGTKENDKLKELAIEVMSEEGIDISDQSPKLISDIPDQVDYLITMGCNVVCPFIPNSHFEDWGLEDPSGGSIEDFRACRDLIKEKVIDLIARVKEEN